MKEDLAPDCNEIFQLLNMYYVGDYRFAVFNIQIFFEFVYMVVN